MNPIALYVWSVLATMLLLWTLLRARIRILRLESAPPSPLTHCPHGVSKIRFCKPCVEEELKEPRGPKIISGISDPSQNANVFQVNDQGRLMAYCPHCTSEHLLALPRPEPWTTERFWGTSCLGELIPIQLAKLQMQELKNPSLMSTAGIPSADSEPPPAAPKFKPGQWVRRVRDGALCQIEHATDFAWKDLWIVKTPDSDFTETSPGISFRPALPRKGEWWMNTKDLISFVSAFDWGSSWHPHPDLVPVNFGRGNA